MSGGLLIFPLIALAPLVVIGGAFCLEVILGLFERPTPSHAAVPNIRAAILIPAHNEERILHQSINSLSPAIFSLMRVVVVADNCTDCTADVARSLGCEVVERNDPTHRGKGFALAAGRTYLSNDPPEIVVIIDADCFISPDSLAHLVGSTEKTGAPTQASYLFRAQPDASPNVQISIFAFAIKNLVRQRGGRKLGAAAILTGSGMAFPWTAFQRLELANANIVEDLAMGIDLVKLGYYPNFEDRATVLSDASSEAGTQTQRARWEGGFIATARQHAFPLMANGLANRRWKLIWLGLHLLIPPLSLMIIANLFDILLLAGFGALNANWWPFIVATLMFTLIIASVFAAWVVVGRKMIRGRVLLRLPFYLFWKIALHARLAIGHQAKAWTRTARVHEEDASVTTSPPKQAAPQEHRSNQE